MARTVRFLKESQKEFQKVFSGLCRTWSSWQAWSDFVELSAISISNALDHDSPDRMKREERYLQVFNSYPPSEQSIFSKLLYITAEALEANPDQDFLGEMFMGMELSNHWKGQFFTPYNVCRMIGEMQLNDAETLVEKRGWFGIQDPCCGAGALLIAARNVLSRAHIGHTCALFVAQDIDYTAGLMCYIQLSLLGCAGYVVIADSILHPLTGPSSLLPIFQPEHDVWFMPMFYDQTWQHRILWAQMELLLGSLRKEPAEGGQDGPQAAQTPSPAPVPAAEEPPRVVGAGGQLSLF